jgi:hypothetical protein
VHGPRTPSTAAIELALPKYDNSCGSVIMIFMKRRYYAIREAIEGAKTVASH